MLITVLGAKMEDQAESLQHVPEGHVNHLEALGGNILIDSMIKRQNVSRRNRQCRVRA